MRLLLFGEFGEGTFAHSLEPGLATESSVVVTDPYRVPGPTRGGASRGGRWTRRLRARRRVSRSGAMLVEAVEQLRPDAVVVVKGRGLDAPSIAHVRDLGVPVALYYPDNPFWAFSDTPGAAERLAACSLVVTWSERLAARLRAGAVPTRVLPFGYDARWWPPVPPGGDRQGIVFLGQWSSRRERYLSALEGLPLVVRGAGWERTPLSGGGPVFGAAAGALLARAAIGVNVLHLANAGSHNMRTREIAASGALLLTHPGTDGTPLRPPGSCVWFESPGELRALAERYLARPDDGAEIARRAQSLTLEDTYVERGRTLARWVRELA